MVKISMGRRTGALRGYRARIVATQYTHARRAGTTGEHWGAGPTLYAAQFWATGHGTSGGSSSRSRPQDRQPVTARQSLG